MDYSRSVEFNGDIDQALDHAAAALEPLGFRVSERNATSILLLGPGMNSTKQNPLVGATIILIEAENNQLHLQADLGGVRFMRKFLYVLPASMALGFGVLFGVGMGIVFGQVFKVGFGVPFAPGWKWLAFIVPVATAPLLPWHFLSPYMSRRILNRTEQALDGLLEEMTKPGD